MAMDPQQASSISKMDGTGLPNSLAILDLMCLAFSPGLSHFQVPGLLDFFSPGTTRPRDLQDL